MTELFYAAIVFAAGALVGLILFWLSRPVDSASQSEQSHLLNGHTNQYPIQANSSRTEKEKATPSREQLEKELDHATVN